MTAEEFVSRLQRVKKSGSGWLASCPAHDDQNPSLSVADGDKGVVVTCHAGCAPGAIVAALGLQLADLFYDQPSTNGHRQIAAVYPYVDEVGEVLFEVVRYSPKRFLQRRFDPFHPGTDKDGHVWKLGNTRRVPYRLPLVLAAAKAGHPVWVAEGEKDVLALEAAGVVATCNPAGAGKWRDQYAEHLRGASEVVIVADRDEAGIDHANTVAASVRSVVGNVQIVQAAEGKDAADHLAAGLTVDQFRPLADSAVVRDEQPVSVEAVSGWPDPLAEVAYHGVVGEFVRVLDPNTEADPASVLITTLVMVGNCLGRESFAIAEADRHSPCLFGLIVGETSKGRKGSGAGQVRRLMRMVDPTWETNCIDSGLVSGEGLVWSVRDAISKQVPVKDKGKATGDYTDEVVDQGVHDKRRLYLESEFSSVIKAADRERNTLSAKVRDAWDGSDLRTAAKNVGARATRPHVGVVGHITRDELRRHLTATESVNGFLNRFLLCCARRSKELPEGGNLADEALVPIGEQLATACQFAGVAGLVQRDEDARDLWRSVYGELSQGKPGLLGAATARAEAQVLRLSVLYALLDLSSTVGVEHLQAALEVWRYCERSAAWVFGDATGDPVADEILMALREAGRMTRTGIRDLLGRNQPKERIEAALRILSGHRLASVFTDGKTETWVAL